MVMEAEEDEKEERDTRSSNSEAVNLDWDDAWDRTPRKADGTHKTSISEDAEKPGDAQAQHVGEDCLLHSPAEQEEFCVEHPPASGIAGDDWDASDETRSEQDQEPAHEQLQEGVPRAESMQDGSAGANAGALMTSGAEEEAEETPKRYFGRVKSVGNDYGFIICERTRATFSRDVYIRRADLPEALPAMPIKFCVALNEKGRPQAREIEVVPESSVREAEEDERRRAEARAEVRVNKTPRSVTELAALELQPSFAPPKGAPWADMEDEIMAESERQEGATRRARGQRKNDKEVEVVEDQHMLQLKASKHRRKKKWPSVEDPDADVIEWRDGKWWRPSEAPTEVVSGLPPPRQATVCEVRTRGLLLSATAQVEEETAAPAEVHKLRGSADIDAEKLRNLLGPGDLVRALCFRRPRSFLLAIESELLRLLAAPPGASLSLPDLAPRYRGLLNLACGRFCMTVEQADARTVVTRTAESCAPLPSAAFVPKTWAQTEPKSWTRGHGPASKLAPCPGLRIPASCDLKPFETTAGDDTVVALGDFELSRQPHHLGALTDDRPAGEDGGFVLALTIDHGSAGDGVAVALGADDPSVNAVLATVVAGASGPDRGTPDDGECTWAVCVSPRFSEGSWLLELVCSAQNGARTLQSCRASTWESDAQSTDFWVAVSAQETGETLLEVGLGRFPWCCVLRARAGRSANPVPRVLAMAARGPLGDARVRGVELGGCLCPDRASREHVVRIELAKAEVVQRREGVESVFSDEGNCHVVEDGTEAASTNNVTAKNGGCEAAREHVVRLDLANSDGPSEALIKRREGVECVFSDEGACLVVCDSTEAAMALIATAKHGGCEARGAPCTAQSFAGAPLSAAEAERNGAHAAFSAEAALLRCVVAMEAMPLDFVRELGFTEVQPATPVESLQDSCSNLTGATSTKQLSASARAFVPQTFSSHVVVGDGVAQETSGPAYADGCDENADVSAAAWYPATGGLRGAKVDGMVPSTETWSMVPPNAAMDAVADTAAADGQAGDGTEGQTWEVPAEPWSSLRVNAPAWSPEGWLEPTIGEGQHYDGAWYPDSVPWDASVYPYDNVEAVSADWAPPVESKVESETLFTSTFAFRADAPLWEPTSAVIDASCVESADALAWCTVPETLPSQGTVEFGGPQLFSISSEPGSPVERKTVNSPTTVILDSLASSQLSAGALPFEPKGLEFSLPESWNTAGCPWDEEPKEVHDVTIIESTEDPDTKPVSPVQVTTNSPEAEDTSQTRAASTLGKATSGPPPRPPPGYASERASPKPAPQSWHGKQEWEWNGRHDIDERPQGSAKKGSRQWQAAWTSKAWEWGEDRQDQRWFVKEREEWQDSRWQAKGEGWRDAAWKEEDWNVRSSAKPDKNSVKLRWQPANRARSSSNSSEASETSESSDSVAECPRPKGKGRGGRSGRGRGPDREAKDVRERSASDDSDDGRQGKGKRKGKARGKRTQASTDGDSSASDVEQPERMHMKQRHGRERVADPAPPQPLAPKVPKDSPVVIDAVHAEPEKNCERSQKTVNVNAFHRLAVGHILGKRRVT